LNGHWQPKPESLVIDSATVIWTDARHGDQAVASKRPDWVYVNQVHGNEVFVANDLGSSGVDADAVVTGVSGLTVGVQTADCAPVALVGDNGMIAAVHAGWKGLRSHVIRRAAGCLRELGALKVQAALGPCIHSECYEFGLRELSELVELWGDGVAGRTGSGREALDLPVAVDRECEAAGVQLIYRSPACTGCSGQHFSYRKQKTRARQVMLVEMA
jgi:polyphenol oxidase